jgi:hypothetical protein
MWIYRRIFALNRRGVQMIALYGFNVYFCAFNKFNHKLVEDVS